MNTEHRIEVDTLKNNMIEEQEIILSGFEVKAYEEMFQQIKKYERLQAQFKELEDRYNHVKETYEKRIKEM
jgi:predicted component of type VI protein secretion system